MPYGGRVLLLQEAGVASEPFVSGPYPSQDEFERLTAEFDVVPVWIEILADLNTPLDGLRRISAHWTEHSFLLESVEGGERWGRYSILGGDVHATVRSNAGAVEVAGSVPAAPHAGETPLAYVRRLMTRMRGPHIDDLPPFYGGAVGYLSYDCVRELERLPHAPPDDLALPEFILLLTRTIVVFDHLRQKAFVIAAVPTTDAGRDAYDAAAESCHRAAALLRRPQPVDQDGPAPSRPRIEPIVGDDEFAEWVAVAREHIRAGDIFQVVPSRRFEGGHDGDLFDSYRALRALNPSPYMYLLRLDGGAAHGGMDIAGSSPEPLVRVAGDRILSRPIAGTRGRGVTETDDESLERDLLADEKERAEHVMLVDLSRNDVGRVSRYGSVEVPELMVVERYSHVMHLVSSVTGVLRPELTAFDALLSCFPAGTVTGAPKVRAMEIIDELEKTRRGPYAGVVGYLDYSGNIDTAITIRTLVAAGGRVHVQAGAGVVADSDPHTEAEETRRKAEALVRALTGQWR